jgi:hypothetical protein
LPRRSYWWPGAIPRLGRGEGLTVVAIHSPLDPANSGPERPVPTARRTMGRVYQIRGFIATAHRPGERPGGPGRDARSSTGSTASGITLPGLTEGRTDRWQVHRNCEQLLKLPADSTVDSAQPAGRIRFDLPVPQPRFFEAGEKDCSGCSVTILLFIELRKRLPRKDFCH